MTRNNLISLIVLDVIVMLLSIGLLAYRYQALVNLPVSSLRQPANTIETVPQKASSDTIKSGPGVTTAEKDSANAGAESRNIFFVYRNSKAKKVDIIGDFTEWMPMKMTRGAAHTWKITVTLAPGDYAYNYVVDGKPKRDPNNPKVCNAGRGFPNSFLKVKPLSNDNKKAE